MGAEAAGERDLTGAQEGAIQRTELTIACYPFRTSWGERTKQRRGSFFEGIFYGITIIRSMDRISSNGAA